MPLNSGQRKQPPGGLLHGAALAGLTEVVVALLSRGPVEDIDLRSDDGDTAVMLASLGSWTIRTRDIL